MKKATYGRIPYELHEPLKVALEEIKICLPYSKYADFKSIDLYQIPGVFKDLPSIYIKDSNIVLCSKLLS